jgi:hypothetical protein
MVARSDHRVLYRRRSVELMQEEGGRTLYLTMQVSKVGVSTVHIPFVLPDVTKDLIDVV